MATTFVSAITDEAIQRICYNGGGWELTPFRAAISEDNILDQITIFDEDGNLTPEAAEKMTSMTSDDYNLSERWFELPFSSLPKSGSDSKISTLTHHIVIPSNYPIGSAITKNIGTIFFIYQEHKTQLPFLYAVACPSEPIVFEKDVPQSLFFNFSIKSSITSTDTNYIINYTYPQDIDDHNFSSNVHDDLVKRDGSRFLTNTLKYQNESLMNWNNEASESLVSKRYIDELINKLKVDNNLR